MPLSRPLLARVSAIALACASVAAVAACKPQAPSHPSGAATSGQPSGPHGVVVADMDRSVAPGDDFYRYANGHWTDTTQIPADRSSWGEFARLRERADQRTKDLVQEIAARSNASGTDQQKIGDYYASFMDEQGIEQKGVAPLKPKLDRIAAISDLNGLSRELGAELRADVDPLNNTNFHTPHLFGLWVAQDFNKPDRYAPYLLQGGLGLPDKDYYTDASAHGSEIRAKYEAHIANMLKLAGVADADARAKRIMALETKIARAHWSGVASRDVVKADNPWTRADFDRKAPGIDWTGFLQSAGLGAQQDFIAWQPSAITGLSALVKSQPLEVWKDYLTFHAIDDAAPFLPKAFVAEDFDFNGKTLTGAPQLRERWKRGVEQTNNALGWAIGRLYAEKYFPPEAKAKAQALVDNLIAAYRDRLQKLTWMSQATKAKALEKLNTLWIGMGYPDSWRDYSRLQIVKGDALGNADRASLFEYQRNLAKLGQPVDRHEWSMTPQTVNAVNLPLQNGLNFPAAILDGLFFDPKADAAVNYGGIGTVIGHEISHSFDNQGAQFDAAGALKMWWTPADFAHFSATSRKLAAQYDAYQAFPDLHLNGKLTLGENIADVAGVAAAHDAYERSLGGKPAPARDGLTGEQQFFISYAQVERGKYREEALRRQIKTNEHSPGQWRTYTVRNNDAWYAAFGVQPNQKLYLAPKDRVNVW
jgi:putative endopeptidase